MDGNWEFMTRSAQLFPKGCLKEGEGLLYKTDLNVSGVILIGLSIRSLRRRIKSVSLHSQPAEVCTSVVLVN